jgi:hypothetical protein
MTNPLLPLVTSGARRGCGYRQPGGAYFAVPVGPGGRPIEEFLIDPPVVIDDPRRLGLASVGVTLIERDGVTHVIDIVGREHYPTVASFIDEARRLGISRRAPRTIDFARITPASRLLLAHPHADIANAAEFRARSAAPATSPSTWRPDSATCAPACGGRNRSRRRGTGSRCSPPSRSRRSRS